MRMWLTRSNRTILGGGAKDYEDDYDDNMGGGTVEWEDEDGQTGIGS